MNLSFLNKVNPKFLIGALIAVVILGVLFFIGMRPSTPTQNGPAVEELEVWGVFDNADAFEEIADRYSNQRGIDIVYRKQPFETYEQDLVDALASGRGPDLFMIHNAWRPKHQDKIVPAPQTPQPWVTPTQMDQTFVETVVADFTDSQGRVWGIPLYVDSLALYYNRDFLNTAGITEPPATWAGFLDAVEATVVRDEQQRITRAGAALGTAENVNRSTDILAALMLQSGSKIVSDDHRSTTFDRRLRPEEGESFVPGEDALRFYTDFANPQKRVYTWNRNLDFSIDMFSTQRAAMMINYQHHIPTLEAQSPNLNFDVAELPQIAEDGNVDVNYASYWGLAASRDTQSAVQREAWRFLLWMAQRQQQETYRQATGRPPARRDIIETVQEQGGRDAVFARQALTAESWYQPDTEAVEDIFATAIRTVVLREASIGSAIDRAAERISELLRQLEDKHESQ